MPKRFLASVLPRHETAELYRLMVVGIRGVAVFLMDPKGIITVWNAGAQDMKGYSADEAIGSHLRILYTDEDRAAGRPEHNLAVAARDGFHSEETWRRRKDGSLFWAHVALTALRNEQGELLGFSKVTMDLTRHKELEECRKEKEEIDLILNAADSGTWKWDIGRNQVAISTHLMELLGYEGDGRTLSFEQWLGFVHADERPTFRADLQQAVSVAGAAPFETEVRFLNRSGDYQWFFLRAKWHRTDGDPSQVFMGACVAIDSLKQVEEETRRLLAKLDEERNRFASVLDQLPSGVVLAEAPTGALVYQNQAACAMLGADLLNITGYHEFDRLRLLDAEGEPIPAEQLPLARTVLHQETVSVQDLIYERADGARLHLAVTTTPIRDPDGMSRLAVAVVHDVTAIKQAELAAASEKERVLVTLAAITDGVVSISRAGVVASLNPAAERLTGVVEARARARPLRALLQCDEDGGPGTIADAVDECLRERRVIARLPHLTLRGRDAMHFAVEAAVAPVTLPSGELIGAVLVLHDVTESKRLMRRLGFEASHDALTGLVNRREFEVRLARAIERAHHAGAEHGALLYLDLDQFKIVNDTCGHQAGDDLLKMLAATYLDHVRERDTLARIGGDEFALIVEHCHVEEALAVAHKILDATRAFRYACKDQVFQLGVSIGVTPIDEPTASVEECMRRADHACYLAKEQGRNRIYVHSNVDADFAQRRSDMHWVNRLTHAFQNDQLQLYCQPIQSLDGDNALAHYEILLRLRNGGAHPILPASFLPAAERYDVILEIDRWVLRRTLAWLAEHPQDAARLDMCSINLSRRSLADRNFHQFAAELIDASPVPARKLCFEITEHGAIADMNKTITFIEALAARGCRFSLDDFGTGMTSFSYLKQLPVDFIKIDGSFIQMMESSPVDFEMVRFTNDISHMMGRKTIAEYVTDQTILARLREIGVDFAQGYCIGRPRPLTD